MFYTNMGLVPYEVDQTWKLSDTDGEKAEGRPRDGTFLLSPNHDKIMILAKDRIKNLME